ncbi:heparin-sulfate lyase HepC [Nubsella zeaxanthinifaciens]|uniref:heparin-sulfate lyase HepC n=1 Tax=Nubsella zeaxanthinifaciens TaxID=392412 RepID=UPI000DE3C671|nr:heparin-sulfate lyase HepC [Nubsella zeaxanthinifaciens]
MKTIIKIATIFIFCLQMAKAQEAPITKQSFQLLNLSYPGLEKVNQYYTNGDYNNAATALLSYFRHRKSIKHPEFNQGEEARFRGKDIGKANLEKAEKALLHQFQPQKGYGFFDYGKDINWQYWPVKDNEVRWQLHRVTWWQPMGLAYRSSGDEKYAKEWIFQFRDWNRKNPLGLSSDNDKFAWRPLEVSERVQSLPGTFNLFLNSPSFTPAFLMEFLNSYHQQAAYIPPRYSDKGNHLLFEAQRVLFAGAFFPEFNDAEQWRKSGIAVLNTEIKKQVYADGVQFELSPVYHAAAIDIFLKAYNAAKMSKLEAEFPASYSQTIENMIMALISFTFPDYNSPMFGDSWLMEKEARKKQFASWSKAFPANESIRFFATEGEQGKKPNFLSKGLTNAGFYTFRNGWDNKSTVMVLKASPPGEFHAQPDNGTFELWKEGRNFTPDAGCFVYSGDAEITKQRNWFRQTRVHNTLTLDNQNMRITDAKLLKWESKPNLTILSYNNPSYSSLQHQRTVLFIDQQYFIIVDIAKGSTTGTLDQHFHLKEDSKPYYNVQKRAVNTNYADGNNLLIQNLDINGQSKLIQEETKVSYFYQKEMPRPALSFQKVKESTSDSQFISIMYPYQGDQVPAISLVKNKDCDLEKGLLSVTININGKSKVIKEKVF